MRGGDIEHMFGPIVRSPAAHDRIWAI